MDIEIKKLGEIGGKEIGMDQHKNIYERYVKTTAWYEIFAYRRKEEIIASSDEEIKIVAEKNLFYWGVDNEGNFWKKYKHYHWNKMRFEDQPKYGLSSTIVATRGQTYSTSEENGTIIRRDDDVPLNQVRKRMFDVHFNKMIFGKIRKRKTMINKNVK